MPSTMKRATPQPIAQLLSHIRSVESENRILRCQLDAALAKLKGKLTPEQLCRMKDAGASYLEISKQTGRTVHSVRWSIRIKRGYKRPKRGGVCTTPANSAIRQE